jgi:hypothetical protein
MTIELQTGTRVDETLKTADKVDKLISETVPRLNCYQLTGVDDD